jgi:hypothetical protein
MLLLQPPEHVQHQLVLLLEMMHHRLEFFLSFGVDVIVLVC